MSSTAIVRSLVLALGLTALSAPASARQDVSDGVTSAILRPPSGLQEAFQPDFVEQDTAVFAETLALDEEQQLILETLFDDYAAAFRSGADAARQKVSTPAPRPKDRVKAIQDEVREEMERLREEARTKALAATDPEERRRIMEEFYARVREGQARVAEAGEDDGVPREIADAMALMSETVKAWQAEKSRLRDTLVANVKALLRPEQTARWPLLERTMRRIQTMFRGVLSGESIDLIIMFENIGVATEARAAVLPILDAYAARLDEALIARNTDLDASNDDLMGAMQTGDWAKCLAIHERRLGLHQKVRDVNETHLKAIVAALPAEGAAFRAAYDIRAYPRIYRPTRAARLMDTALRTPGVGEEARQAVTILREQFDEAVVPVNEELRAAFVANEPAQQRRQYERMANQGGELPPSSDPIVQAFGVRTALENTYVDRLREIIGDRIFARLPGAGTGMKLGR